MSSHETIFHITTPAAWDAAVKARVYEADTLKTEGFMHCSTREQMHTTLTLYYGKATEVMVLELNVKKITSELKWDLSPERQQLFPHIYGPLNLEAVADVSKREKKANDPWPEFKSTLKIDNEFAERLEKGWEMRSASTSAEADKPFDYENDYPSDHYTDEEEAEPTKVEIQLDSKFTRLAEAEENADDGDDDDWD